MTKTIQKNLIALSGLFILAQTTMIPAASAAVLAANTYSQAATSADPIIYDNHIAADNSLVSVSEDSDGLTIKSVAKELTDLVSIGKVVDNPNPTKEEIKSYVLNEAKKLGLNTREVEIIVNCESKWNDKAYNDKNSNGSTDSGLWQINSIHKSISDADKMDYKASTKWALSKRLRDGNWSAWSCARKLAAK